MNWRRKGAYRFVTTLPESHLVVKKDQRQGVEPKRSARRKNVPRKYTARTPGPGWGPERT